MYERFYHLRERPFALSPDPDYLYPSRVHQEALSYLRYGIEGRAGFVVITGEIGSGKTTLLQTILRGLDRDTTVARLVNTMLDARELIEAILIDFGLPPAGSKPANLHALAEFLVRERQDGRLVLLIVDEAQNLGTDALEEVRMLSNLETEKSKLVQIILVGQPDLRETLARPDLEQLRQRITVSYHLGPLDVDDTAAYINHRLRRAAAGPPIEFPREVSALIHRRSRGVPRIINVICDAVLLFGYGAERLDIDLELANEAVAELEDTGVLAPEAMPAREPRPADLPVSPADTAVADESRDRHSESELRSARSAARLASDAGAAQAHEREIALRAREASMARREEALVEQRRVLEEQYKLLGAPGRHAEGDPDAGPRWPPVAAYPRPPAPEVVQFAPDAGGVRGVWSRVRRAFGAAPAAALDERS